jgi:hypothetical protein
MALLGGGAAAAVEGAAAAELGAGIVIKVGPMMVKMVATILVPLVIGKAARTALPKLAAFRLRHKFRFATASFAAGRGPTQPPLRTSHSWFSGWYIRSGG